jgi:hypothetical protein
MKSFHCTCGNALYFESSQCLRCGLEVGYDPMQDLMRPLDAHLKRCANGARHGVCNWLLPAASSAAFCRSCRLTRTIPDLGTEQNRRHWGLMEAAKRRLIHTLHALRIPLPSLAEDPQNGLAFDIVSTTLDPRVTMGHLGGVITVSLEEADDTWRQINRQQLGEASRTLLGHFRHESGHYLWDRFLSRLEWMNPARFAFREVFGNESFSYSDALQRYYRQGPPADWQQRFITPYAAAHPWEDWAETWAHYLQIVDGLETGGQFGIRSGAVSPAPLPDSCTLPTALASSKQREDSAFHDLLQRWLSLVTVMNEVSRSFGAPLLYPYIISPPAVRKLRLAHHFAGVWGSRAGTGGSEFIDS